MTALELSAAIKNKKLSVTEAVNTYIEKINKNDTLVKTFITTAKESALKRAAEIQSRIDKGETLSPLAGVPIAIKDNISTEGLETTCASKMLDGYKPVFNAAVTEKLERAGLIIIGKLNMDEFAVNSSNNSSATTAAAVVAGQAPITLGTDTGGNIRHSCSLCGVTGIKPTYGSVSRYGIISYASSLDQAGPIGQDIKDCAALLSIISGPDERDSTCIIKEPFDFSSVINGEPSAEMKGVKIGLPRNFFAGLDEDVKTAILAAAKKYESAGAVIIEEFEMPLTEYIIPAYCIIASAESSSNFAKYDGLKYGYRSPNVKTLSDVYRLSRTEGFGFDVKKSIMLGSLMLSSKCYDAYYRKALQARSLIRDAYNKLFEQFDFILSPVVSSAVYTPDEKIDDPMTAYTKDIYTASVNLAGLPAAAVPCGLGKQGTPIGFQLIGNAFSEKKLIDAVRVYQERLS